MTSVAFHFVMLVAVAAISLVAWYGYRLEPCERRTALKFNGLAGVWFLYLFWNGPPALLEESFVRGGLFVLSLVLAINARRLLLGLEYVLVRHWAAAPISSALRSGREIDVLITARLGDRTSDFFFPGLRIFFQRRKAEQARALWETVHADALLREAIVRRERARQEAETLLVRRRAASKAWQEATRPRRRVRKIRRRLPAEEKRGASV